MVWSPLLAQEELAFLLAQASACDCYNNTIVDLLYEPEIVNSLIAGFVSQPEDWNYSSLRDFCSMKGMVELNFSS